MEPSGGAKALKNLVGALFLLICVRLAWNEYAVLRAGHGIGGAFRGVWRALQSKWVIATLVDLLGGLFFAALYIMLLRGPALCGIPFAAVAVLSILLGPFVPLLYVGLLLIESASLYVLAPCTSVEDGGDEDSHSGPVWLRPKWVGAFFLCYLVLVLAVWWVPLSGVGLKGGREMFRNQFSRVIAECYIAGTVFIAVVLIMCEGGTTWSALAWFVAVVIFGNVAAYIYVIIAAAKAHKGGVSVRKYILTPPNAAPPTSEGLAAQGGTALYSAV